MLTDLAIAKLPYSTGWQYIKWDFPCFGIRVGKRTKTFIIRQANRNIPIGRYPFTTLKQAREEAHRRLGRRHFRSSLTVADAVDLYTEAKKNEHRDASKHLFGLYLKHLQLERPINELTAQHLYDIMRPFKPSAANMFFSVARAFLNWCVDNEHLQANPLHKRKQPHKTQPKRRLLTDEEIKLIWDESYNHGVLGNIVRSLILSAQRIKQIRSFDHSWVKDGVCCFPGHIMKGKQDHTIPISAALQSHLPRLNAPMVVNGPMLDKLRAPLKIPHFTPHHFRHYFSSTQAKLGTPIDVTEAILAHTSGSRTPIQRIYDQYARIEPMKLAFQKFEAHLNTIGVATAPR